MKPNKSVEVSKDKPFTGASITGSVTMEEFAKGAKATQKKGKKDREKKSESSGETEYKLKQNDIEIILQAYFEDGTPLPNGPRGPQNWPYYIYRPTDESGRPTLGWPRVLKVDHKFKTVRFSDYKEVMGGILAATSKIHDPAGGQLNKFAISNSAAEQLAKRMNLSINPTRQFDRPKMFGFKSDPEYVFNRLWFDPYDSIVDTTSKFPTIALNLNFMTNGMAFCQKIGSIFSPDADRKQMIWLYGPGDCGKSMLLDIVKLVAGGEQNCAVLDEDDLSGSFGLAQLEEKGVWIGDEITGDFLKLKSFKKLTGGTPVLVNPKGTPQYTANLNGTVFIASNERPNIRSKGDGYDNRIILCECEEIPNHLRLSRKLVKKRMIDEIPYFVAFCMQKFTEVGGNGTIVPEDTSGIDAIIDEHNSLLERLFEENFVEDEESYIFVADYENAWEQGINSSTSLKAAHNMLEWQKYLKNRLGLRHLSKAKKINGTKERIVLGLRKKQAIERKY